MVVDKVERMCTLVMALLGRELTRDQIAERVPGYPPSVNSMRAQLMRDIAALSEEGIEIHQQRRYDGSDVYGLPEDEFYFPDLDLTEDEEVALAAAAAAVDLGNGTVRGTLLQLGGVISEANADVAAVLPHTGALGALWRGQTERATVRFTYNDARRIVEPWALVCQRGWWYVVGFDRGKSAQRVFRVDRIAGAVDVGGPAEVDMPEGFDPRHAVPAPWQLPGDAPQMAEVVVDAAAVSTALAELGGDAAVEERADGSALLRFAVTHPDGFRTWVLGLLDRAEVVGPPALRAHVVDWLASMAVR